MQLDTIVDKDDAITFATTQVYVVGIMLCKTNVC
jgi:hypothetical protein